MNVGDTIAALSSGRLPSAIAIIRVSGPGAFAAAEALAGALPEPRRAALRTVRRRDGSVLDRGLVLLFPGPDSVTGEDVAEFHVHGGPAVVAATLAALTARPQLRLAEPGEFTRRAFENGRLDLTRAEGLADLLAATTEAQRVQALAVASGALGEASARWRLALLDALAVTEAGIDFSDEDDVAGSISDLTAEAGIGQVAREIGDMLASVPRAAAVRDGLTVVLAGAPNVGKSSLLNALVRRDVAIVAATAGTTRDPVEATLELGGVLVTLIDTAGVRETDDPVEREGIARAQARASRADLVLALSDGTAPWGCGVPVRTKADAGTGSQAVHAHRPGDAPPRHVSVTDPASVDGLRRWLADWARERIGAGEPALVGHARQARAIELAYRAVRGALSAREPAVRAEELRLALRALARLVGQVDTEEVLDAVFARFCIGK